MAEEKKSLMRPRRNLYPPGKDGTRLYARDYASWKAGLGVTPAPGIDPDESDGPQKKAVERMLKERPDFA